MKDGEKLLAKPHKRVAHKPRYNNRYIEFFEALSLPTYCAQRWIMVYINQARRRGGSRGSNEPPLKINNGGRKTFK